jgi:hypothetical protein
MKLNGWQKLWVLAVILWGIIIIVAASGAGERLNLFKAFGVWLVPSIGIYLLGWVTVWANGRALKKEDLI